MMQRWIAVVFVLLGISTMILVAVKVLQNVGEEYAFCENKTGIHEYAKDTWKKYLNCSEYASVKESLMTTT